MTKKIIKRTILTLIIFAPLLAWSAPAPAPAPAVTLALPIQQHTENLSNTSKVDSEISSPELYQDSKINNKISEMQLKIDGIYTSSGMNFAVWTGLLLACVAIILTTLGVVMAIFSFLGYKKITRSARDISTVISKNVAEEVARDIAEKIAPHVTESVLVKLFEENKFDQVIKDAVEVVIYRGIQLDDENPLEGEMK